MLALEVAKTLFHELPMDFYGRIHGLPMKNPWILPMKNHGFFHDFHGYHGFFHKNPWEKEIHYQRIYLPSPFFWHSTATEQSFGPPPCMGSSTVQFLVMVNCLDFELVGYFFVR